MKYNYIEIFSTSPFFKDMISELLVTRLSIRTLLISKCGEMLTHLRDISGNNDELFTLYKEFFKHLFVPYQQLQTINNDIKRLERIMYLIKNNDRPCINSFIPVESVQNIPIETVAKDEGINLKQIGDKFIALCPFHEEKTPSFYIYAKTNSFHCFGCQESGGVIQFVQKRKNIDFYESLSYLTRL